MKSLSKTPISQAEIVIKLSTKECFAVAQFQVKVLELSNYRFESYF